MPERRPRAVLRFGLFELDAELGELRRSGIRVPLQDQPFRILVRLLEREGTLVTRDELKQLLWSSDTFVDFEHGLNTAVKRLRDALRDSTEAPRFIETLPRRGYRFIAPVDRSDRLPSKMPFHRWRYALGVVSGALALALLVATLAARQRVDVRPWPVRSIAVLPLRNLTGDPTQSWFADAMTEALSSTMAQIASLIPVSSASTRPYGDTGKTPAQIAHELGVEALLEGSVSREGGRVTVRVALVDPHTGRRLWMESYERTVADAVTMQNEIALAAARQLSVMLKSSEYARLSRRHAANADAYVAYLRGRYLSTRWQEGGCREAEPYLVRAVDLDPGFAPAHASLAICYVFPDRTSRPASEVIPLARASAAKAVALDDHLADAHVALGLVRLRLDYDWPATEREYRRAIELEPGSPHAHMVYAELLAATGRADAAVAEAQLALKLSPFWMDHNVAFGHLLLRVGRFDEAIRQFQQTLALDADYSTARFWLAEAHGYAGAQQTAVAEYMEWLERALVPGRAGPLRRSLQDAYSRSGWLGFWRRELELAEEELRRPETVWRAAFRRYCGPVYMARRYARLGDRNRAFAALERAYTERHHLLLYLGREPCFEVLKHDSRFADLARRVSPKGSSASEDRPASGTP